MRSTDGTIFKLGTYLNPHGKNPESQNGGLKGMESTPAEMAEWMTRLAEKIGVKKAPVKQ
jgi:hypothetical protein